MSLESCLPAALQNPATTITPIAAGLSGAGVYRVEAGDRTCVLKVGDQGAPLDDWRRTLHIQQLAAAAGLAPDIIHADESRRAVVSAFVVDRSFPALYGNPATRDAAIALLGTTIRRLHQIAVPADAKPRDGRQYLADTWSMVGTSASHPAFVSEVVRRILAEPPIARAQLVLCHNDVNPSNLVYDGERLVLLDWETAGANDRFFDTASISVFLRLDDTACLQLLSAYEDAPVATIPVQFAQNRRLAAALCGSILLRLAHYAGYAGPTSETLESTPSMSDFYQRMRAGTVSIASGEGQWCFGLALIKASAES
ncbi:MAG: phosphotransferase [bacterium]